MNNSIIPPTTKRIEYIDALRGFTMILVVVQHIAYFCLHIEDTPSFHSYLQQIRMPLFFLISGFVLYKADVVWNLKHIGGFLKKKFVVQIVSTLIFFTLLTHVRGYDFFEGLTSESKYGYWFTYTLFFYFIFYSIIRFVCRRNEDYIVVLIAGLFYLLKWPTLYEAIPFPDIVKDTLGINHWHYFCFFLIGTLMKKHFDNVQDLMEKGMTMLVCILVFFLFNLYNDLIPDRGLLGVITQFCKSFSGVLIVFAFFRNKQSLFSKEKTMGKCLQYIGKRTLDIYLLHYFLLPFQLIHITSVFKDYPMPVVEFTLSLLVALLVIAFCLLFSNIIRLSPTLAHLLFGVKKN